MNRYRGRFAPSPTGPLHFGSLVAALGSRLDALSNSGEWLVRMEDADTPRVSPGAASQILRQLESFGFEWDGAVLYQSQRTDAYRAALDTLRAHGCVYPCICSRKEIAGSRYPGACRGRRGIPTRPCAWRIRTDNTPVCFEDRLYGPYEQRLEEECGDFVLLRADGVFTYQLAVVVDDAAQGITSVVRGADLLDSTPRQIFLQQMLALPRLNYLHLPVATNAAGEKLSKQTRARPLNTANPAPELWRALRFLGQNPPEDLARLDVRAVWQWAAVRWNPAAIPAARRAR